MPTSIRILVVVLAAIFLLSGTALFVLARQRHAPVPGPMVTVGGRSASSDDPTKPDPSIAGLRIPPFALTTQDGVAITQEVLKGRVTVMDFMFTHCPFICPTLTQKMRDISRKLEGTGVRFLSVSVDPERDTPAVLKAYAERNEADQKRWSFATGAKATVYSIVKDGLQFALYEQPESPIKLESGETMSNLVHPPFFVLVGPDGVVLNIYPVASIPETVDQLVERARAVDATIKR